MTSRPLKDIVPVGKSSSSKSKSSASLLKVSKKPEDSRDDCMLAVDRQTDTGTPRVEVFRGIKAVCKGCWEDLISDRRELSRGCA